MRSSFSSTSEHVVFQQCTPQCMSIVVMSTSGQRTCWWSQHHAPFHELFYLTRGNEDIYWTEIQAVPQPVVYCFSNTSQSRCGLSHHRSGDLRTQKIKSHLVGTQSLNVLPLKPGVGQCIAIHTTLTARDFFLAYFYTSGPFTCIFSKTSPDFSCVGCGQNFKKGSPCRMQVPVLSARGI